MRGLSPNLRGALLVVVAMAAFCINDAFIKDLSTRAPIGKLMAVRGIFTVALMLVILPWLGLPSAGPPITSPTCRQGHHHPACRPARWVRRRPGP